MMITSDVLTSVGSAVLTVGALVPFLKKYTSKIGPVLEQDAKPIANVVNDVVHGVEDVLKIPEFAAVKTELALKEKAIRESEIGRVAGAVLHAYERGFDSLSSNEQGTAITIARSELVKKFPNVTDVEIVSALKAVQALSNGFKDTSAYKNTVALEESLKALTQTQPSV